MKTIFVVPACDSAARLGYRTFAGNLRRISGELKRINPHNRVLVADNSTPKDQGLTRAVAVESGVELISFAPISAGYARFRGLDHAFKNLDAQVAVLGDDDLHVLPEAIADFIGRVRNGADLAIGVRRLRDFATHPWWQVGLEGAFNLYATSALDIWPSEMSLFSLFTDFVSGGQAFGATGWNTFRQAVSEEQARKIKLGCAFFPGIYRRLGMLVATLPVPAPYDGQLWPDCVSFSLFARRVRMILKSDLPDLKLGLTFPLPSLSTL